MTGFTTAARPRLRSERRLGFLKASRCGLQDEGGRLTMVDPNDYQQLLPLIYQGLKRYGGSRPRGLASRRCSR
jgi:hypothetical protein